MKKTSARHRLLILIPVAALFVAAVGVHYGIAQSGNPARVTTDTLTMTGRSDQPMQVYTDTLTMTGQSSQPMHIITDTLTIKGMR